MLARTLRWLGVNFLLTAGSATAAYGVVWTAGALGARVAGAGRLDAAEYTLILLLSAGFMWPLYMAVIAWVSFKKRESFRRWAVGTSLLLGAVPPAILFVQLPEVQAAILFYLLYGLIVRPLEGRAPAEMHSHGVAVAVPDER